MTAGKKSQTARSLKDLTGPAPNRSPTRPSSYSSNSLRFREHFVSSCSRWSRSRIWKLTRIIRVRTSCSFKNLLSTWWKQPVWCRPLFSTTAWSRSRTSLAGWCTLCQLSQILTLQIYLRQLHVKWPSNLTKKVLSQFLCFPSGKGSRTRLCRARINSWRTWFRKPFKLMRSLKSIASFWKTLKLLLWLYGRVGRILKKNSSKEQSRCMTDLGSILNRASLRQARKTQLTTCSTRGLPKSQCDKFQIKVLRR